MWPSLLRATAGQAQYYRTSADFECNALSQEQSEQPDITYVENWSLTVDIAIPLKTVLAIFHGAGL